MDHFAMLKPHEQLVKKLHMVVLHDLLYAKGCNFQECFVRGLWNSL